MTTGMRTMQELILGQIEQRITQTGLSAINSRSSGNIGTLYAMHDLDTLLDLEYNFQPDHLKLSVGPALGEIESPSEHGVDHDRVIWYLLQYSDGERLRRCLRTIEGMLCRAIARAKIPSRYPGVNDTVRRYLDVSTRHITLAAMRRLEADPDPLICHNYTEGCWVHVCPDLEDELPRIQRALGDDSLPAVLRKAKSLGCDWVKLDRDADEHDDLPSYDW